MVPSGGGKNPKTGAETRQGWAWLADFPRDQDRYHKAGFQKIHSVGRDDVTTRETKRSGKVRRLNWSG